MITFRKYMSLRETTRVRKTVKLLREAQELLAAGQGLDWDFWIPFFQEGQKLSIEGLALPENRDAVTWIRVLDDWRYRILGTLGLSTADWDFSLSPRDGQGRDLRQFPIKLFLEDLRSPFNVGSLFRSAEAFGAGGLILTPQTPGPEHLRVQRTAMGTEKTLPWTRGSLEELEGEKAVFALEMGGTDLEDFDFPSSGICLVGTEELGLSPQALALADRSLGRVSIPLYGRKSSLNVSVAAGILLQTWTSRLVI